VHSRNLAVVVNSADTSGFHPEEEGSMPSGRSATEQAPVAEAADANDSNSFARKGVQVRLLPGARKTWATSTGERLVLVDIYRV
jgi:hypothetical protein